MTFIVSRITSAAIAATLIAAPVGACAPGNNGTLKVHEQGTPSATESNDPKVCTFNFEGYGFDKGQDGMIVIRSVGQERTEVKRLALPAAAASEQHGSYTETAYITLPDGHYKSTVYGKDNRGEYRIDLKAKSKVFKVNCPVVAPVTPAPVTPAVPSTPTPAAQPVVSTSAAPATPGRVSGTSTVTPSVSAGQGTAAPTVLAATGNGTSPVQTLLNTICLGLGAYTALLRRKVSQ